jgi:two-component sensor histidine kinase
MLIEVNSACLNIFGASYGKELKELSIFTDPNISDDIKKKLRSGQEVRYETLFDFELVREQKRYGTWKRGSRYLDMQITPLIDKDYVFGYLAQVQDIDERKKADESLEVSAQNLRSSLKEKETLLKEVHHRVKNNMQIISSLMRIQARKIKNPDISDIFRQSQDRIKAIALIHEKLYQTDDFTNIDFNKYVSDLAGSLFQSYGVDRELISLKIKVESISLKIDQAIPCGLIINELISNSLKYAFPKGREGVIEISMRRIRNDRIELSVSDNGIGLDEGIDYRNTDSLGLELVVRMAEKQLKGRIELDRDKGTRFIIKFER